MHPSHFSSPGAAAAGPTITAVLAGHCHRAGAGSPNLLTRKGTNR